MIPQQRSEIVQALESSREEFNAAAAGVAEAQGKAKPAPDRWSVLECVEHVVVVEKRYLDLLAAAKMLEAPRVDKQKEAAITAQFPDRTTKREAPEAVRPAGRFTSLAQALEQFNATRSQAIRFAQDRQADLYRMTAEHPRMGALNGAEMLLVIAGHGRRHAEQIREIKAASAKAAK